MTADWTDDNPSAHRASAIYTQGVPAARKSLIGNSGAAKTVAGNGTATLLTQSAIDQPSWQLALVANLPAGAGTVPFFRVRVTWGDTFTSAAVRELDLYGPSGNGPLNPITLGGVGHVRGDTVTAILINLDPAQTLTYSYSMSITSHDYPRDEWRQSEYPVTAPQGFGQPGASLQSDVLATIGPTLAPGATAARLLAVFWGKVDIRLDNPTGGNPCQVTITDPVGDIGPSFEYLNETIAAGSVLHEVVQFGPRPVLVTLKNTGGAGNITPQFTAIIAEY